MEDKLQALIDLARLDDSLDRFSDEYMKLTYQNLYLRLKGLRSFEPITKKLKSKVKMIMAEISIFDPVPGDSGVQDVCEEPVEEITLSGTHVTVLENPLCAEEIHKMI